MHASVMNLHTNYSERLLQKQCKTGGNQYTTITVLQKSGIKEQQMHKKIITRKVFSIKGLLNHNV